VPYDELTPEHIPVLSLDAALDPKRELNLESLRVEGELRPSSDTATHLNLFQRFPQIGSVVHTHSRYATVFAQSGMAIPCLGTTHADYFHGEVPVTRVLSGAEVSSHYEWETGKVIAESFQEVDPLAQPGVLLSGHGPFVWGVDAAKAVETAYALELIADLAFHTLTLKPAIAPLPRHVLDKHFYRKHGKDAYYGQGG
jgi:L-ribulose-5-phosphate 4-epimerase